VGGSTGRLGGRGQHLLKQFLTVGGVMLFQMLAIPDAAKKLGDWDVVMVREKGGEEDDEADAGGGGAGGGGGGQHTSAYVKVLQYPEIRHSDSFVLLAYRSTNTYRLLHIPLTLHVSVLALHLHTLNAASRGK